MNILFNDLQISEQTKKAIEQIGLVETTPIQHFAIPELLANHDIIGQAQTGTGKTFAFAIPILEKIITDSKDCQALIICPTRELTLQVYKEFIKLLKFNKDVRITSIYGGESYTKQFKALSSNPHIIVATPGRVIDHLNRATVNFSRLKMLVLDEADEMLKMGFQEDLETILKDTPKERQTALFSATIPKFIKEVATKYQRNPKMIKIEAKTLTVDNIKQYYYQVKKSDRDLLLVRILDYYTFQSAIIFANTKADVDNLSSFLQKQGYEAEALHGDLKQSQRDYVLNRFRMKKLNLLIATDVAARGLDINHVDMVINYELPFEDEVYVHRIGRTARAGKSGMSISLVYPSMRSKLMFIEKFIKKEIIELEIPDQVTINKKIMENFVESLKTIASNNQENLETLVKLLEQEGINKTDLLYALIDKIKPIQKEYEPIQITKRQNKVDRSFDKQAKSKKQNSAYKQMKINLGKQDGLRPVTLLDYFKKHGDLYPKNIGDIVMSNHETIFQINKGATKRLEKLNGKFYNKKKIKILEVNHK